MLQCSYSSADQHTRILEQTITFLLQAVLLMCEDVEAVSLKQQLCFVFKETSFLRTTSSGVVKLRSFHVLKSLLYLWIALVESNDVGAVELLSENRSSLHLVLGDQWTVQDPGVLILSLKFIACCLRQCLVMPQVKDSLGCLATTFIASHKSSLLDIVHEASLIDFRLRLLDFQLLTEVKHVMIVLSLHCGESRGSSRHGQLDEQHLQTLKEQASSIVSTLSTYLGAASSTRALFRALWNETELEEVLEFDPCHRMLQRGSTFTKRVATELCNDFVKDKTTKLKTAFTQRAASVMGSWEEILRRNEGTEGDWTDEEKRCIIAVANDCVFEVEGAVADCLFQTLRFLWAVHPSRDSFVKYSMEEIEKMNFGRVVHRGSTIAFSTPDIGAIRRGKVVDCDNLHSKWNVEAVDGYQLRTYTIEKFQLKGVQEKSNLVPCFQFGPAPETPNDFSQSLSTPSLGHLLLTARWCRQYAKELQLFQKPSNEYETVLQNLTEITCMLVAEEASLHHESLHLLNGEAFRTTQNHIFDLFGESEDYSKFGIQSCKTDVASLKAALFGSEKVWQRSHHSLLPYLIESK